MQSGNYSFRLNYSGKDECYIARIPEFEGVVGHGDSPQEALREAQVSLEAAIETYQEEGWELPKGEKREEFSGQFRVRIPRSLHRKLTVQAENEGVSLNTHVVMLLSANHETQEWLHSMRSILQTVLINLPNSSFASNENLAGAMASPSDKPVPSKPSPVSTKR